MASRGAALAAVLILLVAARPVEAGPPVPTALEHYQAGLSHYNVQEYEAAIAEFKEAYKLDARPEFLFNLAQAERLGHHCTLAIVAYETFLRGPVPDEFAMLARGHIERCRTEVQAEQRAAELRARTEALNAELAARTTAPPVPVYKRKWFWGVMAGAVGVAVVAITVGVVLGTRDNAQQLPPLHF